jgi:tetrahydromethanopterin S-methyltransferase subunit F
VTANDDAGRELQDFARRFLDEWGDRSLGAEDLVDFAARSVPNVIGAGLTLIRGEGKPSTLAASNELAARVDAIEYECGEGPCLDAIEHDDINVVQDLSTDDRWPRFASRAVAETPVRSMLGVRVFLGNGNRGALNFYAEKVGVITPLDVGIAATMSTLTSIALQHGMERERTANLQIALESSRQIGMAIGILMSSRLLTADQAFEELRRVSQQLNRKVRDVALEVNETGTLPAPPERA